MHSNHGNFHESTDAHATHFINTMGSNHAGDTGHNGYGRAPIGDCLGVCIRVVEQFVSRSEKKGADE